MTQQLRQLRAMSAQSNKAPSGAYKKATPAMLLRQEAERLKLLEQVPLAEAMIWGLQFAAAKLDLMSGDAPEYVGLRYKLICEEVPQ